MTHRPVRALLVPLAVLTAILVGLADPAAADEEDHRDPRGDVARIDSGRGARDGLDIVRVRNRFAAGRLVVSTELARSAEPRSTLGIVVMADGGSRYRNTFRMYEGGSLLLVSSPHPGGTCRETGRFVHRTLTIRFTPPCLRGVSWVRVASYTKHGSGDGGVLRDDAHRGRLRSGDPLRFGPRLEDTP